MTYTSFFFFAYCKEFPTCSMICSLKVPQKTLTNVKIWKQKAIFCFYFISEEAVLK